MFQSPLTLIFGIFVLFLAWEDTLGIEYSLDYGPRLCNDAVKTRIDVIVAGAGSAGATLAGRLSEEGSLNVLLLELGEDAPNTSEIPLMWASLLKSKYDYQYVSEPDPVFFKGLKDQVSSIPRGFVSGGCSSINVAMYIRGNKRDFNLWEAQGCTEWNYESVIKYFLKSEDYNGPEDFDRSIHHIGGPLTVTPFKAPDPALGIFRRGFQELGLANKTDLNSDHQYIGYGNSDSTTRNGLRCSSAKAYLEPAKLRRNLLFARKVLVRRVVFEDDGTGSKKAVGVEVTTPNGNVCVVRAELEVILSLGVIGSAQVLMLSGVGPKEHLTAMGIPVVADLPVGFGYHDHACFIGTLFSDRKSRPDKEIQDESQKLIDDTYKLMNEGISTMGMTKLVAFLNTKKDSEYPDVQLMTMRISRGTMMNTVNGKHKLYNMFGLSDQSAAHFTELNNKTDSIFVIVILLDVRSRGRITLATTDPKDHPKIDTRLLNDPEEVNTLLQGVKFVQKLANTKAFKDYGYELEYIAYEACKHLAPMSDEYWICAFQQIATGFYHPAGTVKMGAADDPTAVLTPQMRVKGVNGLWVVDAGGMPSLVSANPNAAVIMMAEKMADVIKTYLGKPTDYYVNLT